MSWIRHCWGILSGAAQKAQRIELLESMRADDLSKGRTQGAEHLNTLIRKYERRKARISDANHNEAATE